MKINHKELIEMYMQSYHDTILKIDERLKYCKKTKQDTEAEKLHYVLKVIQKHYNERGNLPV